ncbi:MAG: tyrosine-type recombinase/integrase, partial [Selenomonadaceae bacterium]|nr:tyrosine-type recombinase/integrase [Selenomonadaceae bacterium]
QAAMEIDNPIMCHVMPVLIALTTHTGMRQGEVFGLKWEDVDFGQSCIFIRRSLAHVIGKGAVFQEPKT